MAIQASNNFDREDRFFERSWALVTQDSSWPKTVVFLALLAFIPVVGFIALMGFLAEYGRQIAWGQDVAPARSGRSLGFFLKSGLRALGVMLGWMLVISFVWQLFTAIPPLSWLPESFDDVFNAISTTLCSVAVVRATIYQQISAGYEGRRLWEMIDNDFIGLAKIMGIRLVATIITGGVLALITGTSFGISSLMSAIAAGTLGFGWSLPYALFALFVSLATLMFSILADLLAYAAVGLWYRQYNVAAWGKSSDPLPMNAAPTTQGYGFTPSRNYDPQTGEPIYASPVGMQTPPAEEALQVEALPQTLEALPQETTGQDPILNESVDTSDDVEEEPYEDASHEEA